MATGSYEGFPIDRRHLGSPRNVGFHETAWTVILALVAPSDPYHLFQKKNVRPGAALGKPGEA
jgi:hypothetical protein